MEGKKISFGFMKTKKVEKPKVEENREYIACVEEKSIKVIGGEQVKENLPIVIPLKPNTLVTAEKLKEIAEKVEKGIEEVTEEKVDVKEEIIPENETLDQMAVRELMTEAKKEIKVESKELTLPVMQDKLIAEGAKESTLEDYESIPVQDFGLAMLRGMGWDASQQKSKFKQPELRPKGLGLGADKVVKAMQNKKSKEEEEIAITKNSFVKITTGKYSDFYGKVVSLDEDNGRVMVDITMKKETVSLSEFMVQAVTKSEYDREAKVLNKSAFDSYKEKDSFVPKEGQISFDKDVKPPRDNLKDSFTVRQDSDREKHRLTEDKYDRDFEKQPKDRHRYDNRIEMKHRRRNQSYSSTSSSSPERSRYRSKHKSKKRQEYETDSSDSEKKYRNKSPCVRRDIDKKRKGKKKKRDRDRSPSSRKYRK